MDEPHDLPFKVGQLAESKSFENGFRAAWFRCMIKEIIWRKGQIGYTLEFYDFPDEEVSWTKLYQVPPYYGRKSKESKRQLMVRPHYPPMYQESQVPHVDSISEVAVIIEGAWKVGNLVDWHVKDCYWSGRVIKVLDNDKVEIALPMPPEGEGGSYEAFCKDLRPSLDWSPEYGWRVPTLECGDSCCARIIHPVKQGESNTAEQTSQKPVSMTVNEVAPQTPEAKIELDVGESVFGKASSSGSFSTSHVQDAKAETTGLGSGRDPYYSHGSFSAGQSIPLNSMRANTIEAAIMDLEELVNKVKWIKGLLEFGSPLSDDTRSHWKFVEHRASSTPK